jgi:hypothetical protein
MILLAKIMPINIKREGKSIFHPLWVYLPPSPARGGILVVK